MINQLKMSQPEVTSIKFQRCHRLISKNKRDKSEPIICRFYWFPDRQAVWNARSNLAGTSFKLSEDFPPEVIERRRVLFPIMKEARKLEMRSYLTSDKLIIDDKSYTVKTLSSLPSDLDPAKLSTKQYNNVTAFFSSSSPLSNFYPVPELMIDGTCYDHVEQYFQMQKALFAGKPETARTILNTTSPLACKRLGDAIVVDAKNWLPVAKRAMMKACTAKFTQDERAKQFLLDTKDNEIAEATTSKLWGTGLKLSDPNNGSKDKWTGQNLVGQILMSVRDSVTCS